MMQFQTYKKRYSQVRWENLKSFSFRLIKKDILKFDKKTWNDAVSDL